MATCGACGAYGTAVYKQTHAHTHIQTYAHKCGRYVLRARVNQPKVASDEMTSINHIGFSALAVCVILLFFFFFFLAALTEKFTSPRSVRASTGERFTVEVGGVARLAN